MMWGKSGMKTELGWVDITSWVEQDSKNDTIQDNHSVAPQRAIILQAVYKRWRQETYIMERSQDRQQDIRQAKG